MLDCPAAISHTEAVEDSLTFLERLKACGITQAEIGKVLGIAQSNAATFYTPAKNGKLRTLKWDEGAKLLEAFSDRLRNPAEKQVAEEMINEELLTPIVGEIVEQARRHRDPPATRPLAGALARYLRQIGSRPAIHANQDALEAVAHALIAPALEDMPRA